MPIYEFYCPDSNKIYSFFARSLSMSGKVPRCPDNPKSLMEKMVSAFAVTGRAKEQKAAPAGGPDMDDPRMDKVMAEMERDFGGMDNENPDPRQLAQMMRKMSEITGEKMPASMNEMIRRMEAGEDPEKLEAEYGDALEDFEPGAGDGSSEGEGTESKPRSRPPPQRDPTLYEMADYVD